MKKSIFTAVIALLFVGATATANPIDGKKKNIDVKKSSIAWKGYKVTGSHEGTIGLKSGYIEMDNGKLVGGSFTVDMASIVCTDMEGEYKGKLEGHLRSDDFFGTDNHPTAKLDVNNVTAKSGNTYTVQGNLTIKGITKEVSFDMNINGNTATADVKIDRTKYGIKYKSGSFFDSLGDKAIYDEFDLNVKLVF